MPPMNPAVIQLISLPVNGLHIEGMLELPANARGLVLFAHGSGSSRHSPRNNFVARELREKGMGTLLLDLLTIAEDLDYETRFNIPLLTRRLLVATQWIKLHPPTKDLTLGYFGASTGAAAALQAAAVLSDDIKAIVSRGGRPDLAGQQNLTRVTSPTLLLVGGRDEEVIELNYRAYALLPCTKEMIVIPCATHLFVEPGALQEVARQATSWFIQHLKH